MDRPLRMSLGPQGTVLYSSPPFWLYLVVVGIPSLLLTAAVCALLHFSFTSFRRGLLARSAVLLLAALVPFVWFGVRTVQADRADREHASCLAGLAKSGPVASYPDVLVMRTLSWPHATAAQLMLAAGFREVDVIGAAPPDGGPPRVETFTLAPDRGCSDKLEAWQAKGAPFMDFLALGLSRCVNITKHERAPDRASSVVLLRGIHTTLKVGCKGRAPRELRLRDAKGDVLVDYLDENYAERPIFPLLVSLKGFETTPPRFADVSDSKFVLRNLKK